MTMLLALVQWIGLDALPTWGLSLLAGGPVGAIAAFVGRRWYLVVIAALLVGGGTWIWVAEYRVMSAEREAATIRADREAERAEVSELARMAAVRAAEAAQRIAERHRADSAAALQAAQAARQTLAKVREEIARDPDARMPVPAPIGRYLDRLRQRRAAGADAGPNPGSPRGPDRPRAADLRSGTGAAVERGRPRDVPGVGRDGAGQRAGLPSAVVVHRPAAGGAGVQAGGVRF